MNEQKTDSINYNQIWQSLQKHKVLVAIIFIIILSTFLRIQTYNLPGTQNIAEQQVERNIKGNIRNEILQDFPLLPEYKLTQKVEEDYEEFIKHNDISMIVQQHSSIMKDYHQDPEGNTYLLGLDPYHHYQLASHQVTNGVQGELIDGVVINPLMRGRTKEVKVYWNLHAGLEAWTYQTVKGFGVSLMQVAFFLPVILMAIASVIFFFVGKKIAGFYGGLFTGIIIASHQSIISRTVAGFSDTDFYYLIFPGLAILCFLYSFDKNKWRIPLLILAGLSISIHHTVWGGWWFTLAFLLASAGLTIISNWKKSITTMLTLFLSTLGLSVITCGLAGYGWTYGITDTIKSLYKLPLEFINLKAVSEVDLWPNVLTTVAELNPASFNSVAYNAGFGLFFAGMMGLFLMIWICWTSRKKEGWNQKLMIAGLIACWVLSGVYASITSVRFVAILVPSLALCTAYLLLQLYKMGMRSGMVPELGVKFGIIAIACLILVPTVVGGYGMTSQEFPLMNDDWQHSLGYINSQPHPSTITSWWDYGHIFKVAGNTTVTFDGGDQGRRIYWVGKLLVSNNPEQSKAILKMLNCGSDHLPNKLEDYLGDTISAVSVTENIIMQPIDIAIRILRTKGLSESQISSVLPDFNCEPWPHYLILSEDMIHKSGVWAHFGSWNFDKAKMYRDVKQLSFSDGKSYIMGYGFSEVEALDIYSEIQDTPADVWISPWPGYVSGWLPLNQSFNDEVLANFDFVRDEKNGRLMVCSPELKDSLFTRLYLLDEDVEGFEKVEEASNPRVKVYRVVW